MFPWERGPSSLGACLQVHVHSNTRNGNCFLTVCFVSWARLAPPTTIALLVRNVIHVITQICIFSNLRMLVLQVLYLWFSTYDRAVSVIVHPQSSCQAAQKGAPSWVLLQTNSISSNSKPLLIWPRGADCSWQRQCCSPETGQQWEEMGFVHLYWNWLKEGSTFIHFWIFGCVAAYLPSLSPCRGVYAALGLSGSPCEQLSAQSSK